MATRSTFEFDLKFNQSQLNQEINKFQTAVTGSQGIMSSMNPMQMAAATGMPGFAGERAVLAEYAPSLANSFGIGGANRLTGNDHLDASFSAMAKAETFKNSSSFASSAMLGTAIGGAVLGPVGGLTGAVAGGVIGWGVDSYLMEPFKEHIANPLLDSLTSGARERNKVAASLMMRSDRKNAGKAMEYVETALDQMGGDLGYGVHGSSSILKDISQDDVASIGTLGAITGELDLNDDVKTFTDKYRTLVKQITSSAEILGQTHKEVISRLNKYKDIGIFSAGDANTHMMNEMTMSALTGMNVRGISKMGDIGAGRGAETSFGRRNSANMYTDLLHVTSNISEQDLYNTVGTGGNEGRAALSIRIGDDLMKMDRSSFMRNLKLASVKKDKDGKYVADDAFIDKMMSGDMPEDFNANAAITNRLSRLSGDGDYVKNRRAIESITSRAYQEHFKEGGLQASADLFYNNVTQGMLSRGEEVTMTGFVTEAMSNAHGYSQAGALSMWELHNDPNILRDLQDKKDRLPGNHQFNKMVMDNNSIMGKIKNNSVVKWLSKYEKDRNDAAARNRAIVGNFLFGGEQKETSVRDDGIFNIKTLAKIDDMGGQYGDNFGLKGVDISSEMMQLLKTGTSGGVDYGTDSEVAALEKDMTTEEWETVRAPYDDLPTGAYKYLTGDTIGKDSTLGKIVEWEDGPSSRKGISKDIYSMYSSHGKDMQDVLKTMGSLDSKTVGAGMVDFNKIKFGSKNEERIARFKMERYRRQLSAEKDPEKRKALSEKFSRSISDSMMNIESTKLVRDAHLYATHYSEGLGPNERGDNLSVNFIKDISDGGKWDTNELRSLAEIAKDENSDLYKSFSTTPGGAGVLAQIRRMGSERSEIKKAHDMDQTQFYMDATQSRSATLILTKMNQIIESIGMLKKY